MFVHSSDVNKTNNNELENQIVRSDRDKCYAELINDLDLVSRFCLPICCRDNEIREVALDVISKTVEGWLDGVGSPKHNQALSGENANEKATNGCENLANKDSLQIPKEYMELVALHLPIILRLSLSCPFSNVRDKCQHILKIVRDRDLPVPFPTIRGPSAFIDPEEINDIAIKARCKSTMAVYNGA